MARKILKRMFADAKQTKYEDRLTAIRAEVSAEIAVNGGVRTAGAFTEAQATGQTSVETLALGDAIPEPFCIACSKSFKSPAGLKTHERSKSHLALVGVTA